MSCNEWKTIKLKDICDYKTGRLNSNAAEENGIYPFFTCSPEPYRINSYSFDQDAIILAGNNANGKFHINYYSGKFDAYQRTYIMKTKDNGKVDNIYLYYYLSLQLNYLREISVGSATRFLTKTILDDIDIKYPPYSQMRSIGKILRTLDDKIELNNEMNKTLEEMAQSIFKRWFVDFEFPNEDGEPYKSSGGEMVDSELGMIPKGWEVKSLDEITDVGIGKTPPRKEYQWFSLNNEDVKWVSIKDMGNCGTYILETSEYLTNEAIEKFKVKKVPSNTVILSFKLTVGRVAISPCELVTNEAIAHFKIQNSENLTTEFLYSYLKQFNYDLLGSTSSIATAVNSKIIRKIPIIVPPSEIMSKFTSNVSSLFELIKENELEIINLREMRDSLLPKLMSGEIDLSK